jgi:hypothetical protein
LPCPADCGGGGDVNKSLEPLIKHKDVMLMAEIAAWLHNWQKCIDMFVASHWKNNPLVNSQKISEWQGRGKNLNP